MLQYITKTRSFFIESKIIQIWKKEEKVFDTFINTVDAVKYERFRSVPTKPVVSQ